MYRLRKTFVTVFAVALALAFAAEAQERRSPGEGGETYSLGLPGRNLAHGGITGGAYLRGDNKDFVSYATIATYRDFAHPAYTIMGFWGELYGGYRDSRGGGEIDGGARAMVMAPAFKIGGGVDYNVLDGTMDAIFSLVLPLRRGGILGHGSALRVDWLPDRGHSFNIGIDMALQRYAGKTRPDKDHVKFSKSRSLPVDYTVTDPNLEDALTNIGDAAHWINRLTVPFLDHKGFKEKSGIEQFREGTGRDENTHGVDQSTVPERPDDSRRGQGVSRRAGPGVFDCRVGGNLRPRQENELGRMVSTGRSRNSF